MTRGPDLPLADPLRFGGMMSECWGGRGEAGVRRSAAPNRSRRLKAKAEEGRREETLKKSPSIFNISETRSSIFRMGKMRVGADVKDIIKNL